MRKSSAVRKNEATRNANLTKAREVLAAKRAADAAKPVEIAVLLEADVASFLRDHAALNGETPSAIIRRMLAQVRKPGAKLFA